MQQNPRNERSTEWRVEQIECAIVGAQCDVMRLICKSYKHQRGILYFQPASSNDGLVRTYTVKCEDNTKRQLLIYIFGNWQTQNVNIVVTCCLSFLLSSWRTLYAGRWYKPGIRFDKRITPNLCCDYIIKLTLNIVQCQSHQLSRTAHLSENYFKFRAFEDNIHFGCYWVAKTTWHTIHCLAITISIKTPPHRRLTVKIIHSN